MKGGNQVIGKGTYGCVFKPALNCSNNIESFTTELGKVMFTQSAYKDEANISKLLEKADPKGDYLLYPIDKKCQVTKSLVKKHDIADKCMISKQKDDNFEQLIMKDGGQSLSAYIKKLPSKLDRKSLIKLLMNLFHAIYVMVQNNLIHQDIKVDNVVIDSNNISRLIDFGITIPSDKLSKSFLLKTEYFLTAPEYRVERLRDPQKIKDIVLNNLKLYCNYDAWSRDGVTIYDDAHVENLLEYYKNYKNNMNFMNPKTADIYSLGLLIMTLYPFLIPIKLDDPRIVDKFNKLLYDMMTPNPHERINIEDLIIRAKEIISTPLKKKSPVMKNNSNSPLLPPRPPGTKRPAEMSPMTRRICPKGKIINPTTGRYVKEDGKIGMMIVGKKC